MPYDLSKTLVIGISATALFDLSEEDSLFNDEYATDPDNAVRAYRKIMLDREDEKLLPGAGYPLVQALLELNKYATADEPPLVEVVVMSRNSPETGLRILNNIRDYGISITRNLFTGGETVVNYLDALSVDLFLSTNERDAQNVADSEVCAAAVLSPPPADADPLSKEQVRIAFDGDAVLFSEESEIVYKTEGIEEFHKRELANEDVPLPEGPYADLLIKLSKLQERLPQAIEHSPVRIGLITARSSPSDIRVIKTLRKWGVYVDEAFFLGGVEKTKTVRSFKPHIFFDDQDVHLEPAGKFVPAAKVLYKTNSVLNKAAKKVASTKKQESTASGKTIAAKKTAKSRLRDKKGPKKKLTKR